MSDSPREGWIRPSERAFAEKARDVVRRVRDRRKWILTDFLNAREQFLMRSMAGQSQLEVAGNGGYAGAERERFLVMPDQWYPQAGDFSIVPLQIEAQSRQETLTHRMVLGSLLGLGVDRRVVGDIGQSGETFYAFIEAEMADFIHQHWTHAGQAAIFVNVCQAPIHLSPADYVWEEMSLPSLRLDAVLAHVSRLSRARAKASVEGGLIRLNGSVLDAPDERLVDGDTLSVRGFGRIRIGAVTGQTKSERLWVRIGVLRGDR